MTNFLLFIVLSCVGQVNIPYNCRVRNTPPGYCTWASLETLGNFLHILPLKNLVESRKKDPDRVVPRYLNGLVWWYEVRGRNWGDWYAVRDKLDSLRVKYTIQKPGESNLVPIEEAVSRKLGCVVTVNNGLPTCYGPHSILITNFSRTNYQYVDSNRIDIDIRGDIAWFYQEWDGTVITVYP